MKKEQKNNIDEILFSLHPVYYIFIMIALISGILQLLPFSLQESLHYKAENLPSHLYYLWITPHLIHLSMLHYIINILSLGIVLFTFRNVFTPLRFFLLFAFSSFMVTLGLWCCSPEVADYAGMSGVIYGILAAGLLLSMKKHFFLSSFIYFLFIIKIVYEVFNGAHLSIQTSLGNTVIVDAHLYGYLSGTLFTIVTFLLYAPSNKRI